MNDTLTTVASPISFRGVGLHSGSPATARIRPAPARAGIAFRRVDLPGEPTIRVAWDVTGPLVLCTTLRGPNGTEVSTVEHLLAALAAFGVDDALIEVDGPEIPILDGSAAPFLDGLSRAGLRSSSVPRRRIRILRPVEVRDGDKIARLEPHRGFAVSFTIDFPHPVIGRSSFEIEVGAAAFGRLVAPARTFTLLAEVERLRERGLARGGSLENAVVVGPEGILNPGGLRFADEFVRHKALDAIGDLYLAGAPLIGRYVGFKAGHAMNNALLRDLMADPSAWEWASAPVSEVRDAA